MLNYCLLVDELQNIKNYVNDYNNIIDRLKPKKGYNDTELNKIQIQILHEYLDFYMKYCSTHDKDIKTISNTIYYNFFWSCTLDYNKVDINNFIDYLIHILDTN